MPYELWKDPGVAGVAADESARLGARAVEPFQPDAPHPDGRAPPMTCQKIDRRADAKGYLGVQLAMVAVDPKFLLPRAEPHDEQIGLRTGDGGQDAGVLRWVVLKAQGRYNDGLAILPWTLTYCVWYALLSVAQNYIWCAERTRIGTLPYAAGLTVTVVLNLALIPILGLPGAVVATTSSTALAVAVLYGINLSAGMELQRGLVWLTIAPAALCGGAWAGTVMLLAVAVALPFSKTLVTQPERELVAEFFRTSPVTWQTYRARRGEARHAT